LSSKPSIEQQLFNFAIAGKENEFKYLVGEFIGGHSKEGGKLLLAKVVSTPGDTGGNTSLHAAVYSGQMSLVKFLVSSCHADLLMKNDMGCTPLWLAAGYKKQNCLSFLLRNLRVHSQSKDEAISDEVDIDEYTRVVIHDANNNNDTPLIAASSKGYIEICRILLETVHKVAGEAKVIEMLTIKNRNGDTALSVATSKGLECDSNLIDLLLEWELKGARKLSTPSQKSSINHRNKKGLTPLLIACERGNVEIIKKLVKAGAQFLPDSKGASPLSVASFCGQIEVVKVLLELEPSLLNLTDEESGNTPLWHAARTGNFKMVQLLLESGADPRIANHDGLTPLQVAKKYNKSRVEDILSA